jgi:integrase
VRLPDPYTDPDGFERKLAHLRRIAVKIAQTQREGTFGAVVERYRATELKRRAASTQRHYGFYLDRLLVAYADAPLVEMTPEDIQQRVMDANADTPGAADFMLNILRTLYRFASKRQRGLKDWTDGIEKYGHQSEREPWPQHVLDAALKSDKDLFRLAVALHLYTGQRTGDACAMTWRAADGGFIRVRQQKTAEPLEIPLHPNLKAELDRADRSGVVILTNKRGGSLKPDAFRKWCIAFGNEFGVRIGPHGLRKNATNELFELGCTAAQVASITGHRSLAMLEHYGKRRSQPKLARAAIDIWSGKTKRERENP